MKIRVWIVSYAALMSLAGPALACGMAPLPYYVVESESPRGDAVPRNTPLAVQVEQSDERSTGDDWNPRLALTVKGKDAEVPVRASGMAPHLTWIPMMPLEAGTTYEARFNAGYEGEPDVIWEFTTSDDVAPTISLNGKLSRSCKTAFQLVSASSG